MANKKGFNKGSFGSLKVKVKTASEAIEIKKQKRREWELKQSRINEKLKKRSSNAATN